MNIFKKLYIWFFGPKAVTIAIFNENMDILLVSRKGKLTEFGLPGGKIDPFDKLIKIGIRMWEIGLFAVQRETLEETGLRLEPLLITHVNTSVSDDGYKVYSYMYDITIDSDRELIPEPLTEVKWGTWEEAFEGPFGKFNKDFYHELCMQGNYEKLLLESINDYFASK